MPEQEFALQASLGNPPRPFAKVVRDFRIVNVALTRHELENVTQRLREFNAENPRFQLQAGRLFWLTVAEDAKREAEAKYPNCWASACGHVQAVLMLELRSAFENLDKAGYK